jgi:putative transcriptional regulator
MIFSKLSPQQGRLMIAEPSLSDSYFKRSVILLAEHNEQGSVGFILNKPLEMRVSEALEDLFDLDYTLYFGGPVNKDNLFFIHTLGKMVEKSIEVSKGLYCGGNFEQLKELLLTGNANENQVKFFLGYSGWGKDQLNAEMTENAWLVAKNISNPEVMDTLGDEHWKTFLQKQGGRFKPMSDFPINPQLN